MDVLTQTAAEKAIDAVTSGLTNVAGDMGNMVATIVPVALSVVAAVMVVKFGINLFRKLAGK